MTLEPNERDVNLPADEVRRLVSARCDNRISDEQLSQLEGALAKSPNARTLFIDYLDLHASLGWEVTARQPVEELVLAGIANGDGYDVGKPACKPQKATSELSHPSRSVAYALAAVLLVATTFAIWWTSFNAPGATSSTGSAVAGTADRKGAGQTKIGTIVARVSHASTDCKWFVENRTDSDDRKLRVGETLRLLKGEISIEYERGIFVFLSAPAIYEFSTPMTARLIRGQLKARVEKGAEGFAVQTPRAKVVDYGTVFGIGVNGQGSTDVVVFKGEVSVQCAGEHGSKAAAPQRLRMGQGMRVDEGGTVSRIVSITSTSFPGGDSTGKPVRPLIISAVQDNIKRADSWSFYEIVHAGMREDARAFVDREFHEWNGVDTSGMPPYLLGADYVRTFNEDKIDEGFEMSVTITRPAMLYVLFDDRMTPPKWLRDNFENTGDKIGVDVGPFTTFTTGKYVFTAKDFSTGVGAGVSVDDVLSVWKRRVPKPTTLRLGATEWHDPNINMYSVAATPLDVSSK